MARGVSDKNHRVMSSTAPLIVPFLFITIVVVFLSPLVASASQTQAQHHPYHPTAHPATAEPFPGTTPPLPLFSPPLSSLTRTTPQRLAVKIPTAERFTLDNGIVVYFIRDEELPLLHVEATLLDGAQADAEGKEGTARLLWALIRGGGSTSRSIEDIDERLDYLGAAITATPGERLSSLSLTSLVESAPAALEIFADILLNPALPANKMEIFKGIAREEIRRVADNPQSLALRHFSRLMHANTTLHRFPQEHTIKAITREDLLLLHKKLVTPERLFFSASGPGSAAALREQLNPLFGKLKRKKSPRAQVTLPQHSPRRPQGEIYFLAKDSPQCIIIKGWGAPQRASAGSYPLELLNNILGGEGLISRLFCEIRTQKGYAYATGSFYRQSPDFGILGAYAFVNAETMLPTLALLNNIVGTIRQGDFSEAEIALTKSALINRFVFLFASPAVSAQRLLELEYLHLPADFYQRYPERLAEVSKREMQRFAREIFPEEHSLTLIVAPREQGEALRLTYPQLRLIDISPPPE